MKRTKSDKIYLGNLKVAQKESARFLEKIDRFYDAFRVKKGSMLVIREYEELNRAVDDLESALFYLKRGE